MLEIKASGDKVFLQIEGEEGWTEHHCPCDHTEQSMAVCTHTVGQHNYGQNDNLDY